MPDQKTITEELINESERLYETWRRTTYTSSLLPQIRDLFSRIHAAGEMVGDPQYREALQCELDYRSALWCVDVNKDKALAKPNWEEINQAEFGEVKGRMVTELTKLLKRLMHTVGDVEPRRIAIGIINAGWTLAEGGQG